MEQVDRNNTSFPLWNYQRLRAKTWTANDLEMYHQFLVRTYLLDNPLIRGILVFHATGWGKTRLGANTIKEYMDQRQIVVLAPKKVFPKFQEEFRTVGVDTNAVNFISLKANNLTAQVDRLPGRTDDDFGADVLRNTPLDNTFLIVDEAHNLFNAIVNGSKNAVDLYDSIMSAKNIKLLFLSGTPLINTPFELVPCFNMLAGKKLFPESSEDFEKYFVDAARVKNADKFKNRIFGLVSYFGDWIQAVSREHRPRRLPNQVVRVPMSEAQYAIYSGFRDIERAETGNDTRGQEIAGKTLQALKAMKDKGPYIPQVQGRFAPKSSSSTYRIRSRQASNFVPDAKARDHGISREELAPKFYRALEIINDHPGQNGLVCSNFVNVCGLRDLAALLELNGWEEWDGISLTAGKRFAIISGDVDEDVSNEIQKVASSTANLHGKILRLVLVGPAGSEGIEFKNFRYTIMLDPFFNAVRSDQFEGRIDRYASHDALPPKERTVQPYHLLSVYPTTVKPEESARELCTDEYLYVQSKRRKLLSYEFYKLLIEASIDCLVHRDSLSKDRAARIHCQLCAPTNVALFSDNLDKDVNTPNPCKNPLVESIKAKEIMIGDTRFMYAKTKGSYDFFEYRNDLGGYIPVARNHPAYEQLADAVKKG